MIKKINPIIKVSKVSKVLWVWVKHRTNILSPKTHLTQIWLFLGLKSGITINDNLVKFCITIVRFTSNGFWVFDFSKNKNTIKWWDTNSMNVTFKILDDSQGAKGKNSKHSEIELSMSTIILSSCCFHSHVYKDSLTIWLLFLKKMPMEGWIMNEWSC
jgi:hypothetical protein